MDSIYFLYSRDVFSIPLLIVPGGMLWTSGATNTR